MRWTSELENRIRQLPLEEDCRNAKSESLKYEIKKQDEQKADLDKKANYLDLEVSIIGEQF